MDRKKLEQELALVDREIALNERDAHRQRQVIAKLETHGQDASGARDRLTATRAVQALRFADREFFCQELALFRQHLKKIW